MTVLKASLHVWIAVSCIMSMTPLPTVAAGVLWDRHPQRPRLIASEGELIQWREKLDLPEIASAYQQLLSRCTAWVDPTSPEFVDYKTRREDERWRTRKCTFMVQQTLYDLSLAYLLSDNRKFGEFAKDMLLTLIREKAADHVKGIVYGRPYDTWFGCADYGSVARSMAYCFDATHRLMTEDERREVAEHLHERYVSLTFAVAPGKDWRNWPSNQTLERYYGTALAMLSIHDAIDQPRLADRLAQCVKGCEEYFDLQVDDDGGAFEGPGYGGTAVWVCELAHVLRRAGYEHDLAANERLRKMPGFYLQSLLPGGRHISPTGQCFDAMSGSLLLAMCGLHRDRLARFALDLWGGGGLRRGADDLAQALMWYHPRFKGAPPAELGMTNDMVFRGLGTMVVRSGWGPEDYRFSLMAGSGFCGGCPDKGNFTLHALGEAFAVDIGYGALPTERHSSVLIDNEGAVQGERVRAILAEHDITNRVAAYGRLDLTRSWHKASRLWRHACFVRPAKQRPWFVVIGDDMRTAQGDHTFEWIMITAPGNRIEIPNPDTFVIRGRKRSLRAHVLSPPAVEMSTDVIEHRYMVEASKTPTHEPGDFPRIRMRARGRECRFVVVLLPEEQPPVVAHGFEANGWFGADVAWDSRHWRAAFRLEQGKPMWKVETKPRRN